MTEKQEQITLFTWAAYRSDLQLMFHIPNEGNRSVQHTMSLIRQGMKPGVPDIFLPVPKGKYHGLFIELKTDRGKPTAEQKRWQTELLANGYAACVCRGFEEAKETIEWYLRLGEEK